MAQYAYDVYRPGKRKAFDTVYATYSNPRGFPNRASREEDQRASLINHDGYPSDIRVVERALASSTPATTPSAPANAATGG